MKDKILVAKWGYSMILSTWVRVIRESPKTLLVEEIKSRVAPVEEQKQHNLSAPGYLQMYSMPTDPVETQNGRQTEAFRLYRRESSKTGYAHTTWVGHPHDMSTKLCFIEWDGKPEFEDHCD